MEKMNAPVETHPEFTCAEMQESGLNNAEALNDKKFEELMSKDGSKKCPKCRAFVSKTEGCNKMTCLCGCLFCYVCGEDISDVGYSHFKDQEGPHTLFFVPPDTG